MIFVKTALFIPEHWYKHLDSILRSGVVDSVHLYPSSSSNDKPFTLTTDGEFKEIDPFYHQPQTK